MIYAKLGSVSTATLRPDDLIPRFIEVLDELKEEMSLSVENGQEMECVHRTSALDDFLGGLEMRLKQPGYYESDSAEWDLDELKVLLSSFAAPGQCFEERNGEFGFWESADDFS